MTALVLALLHGLRGGGHIDRLAFAASAALLAGWFYQSFTLQAVMLTGLYGAVAHGIGKYFAVIHGNYDVTESEVGWIDWLASKIVDPRHGSHRMNIWWGLAAMSLRGLHTSPLLVACGALAGNIPVAMACIPALLLQGPFYWVAGRLARGHAWWGVRGGELATGALWGLLIWIILQPIAVF